MSDFDTNGLTIGRYRLVERIASGGMGEVFIALQTGIGRFARPIAVKLLLPHLANDAKSVSMFLTEARIGAQMSHANIAQVYDVGLEHDRYFIAMELVRGVSLHTLIAGLKGAGENLPLDLLAFIGRSLCEGLHVAHEQSDAEGRSLQLVHRDVTPHNVLISVEGAVKLTDFGIARVADADRLSRPGVVMGKLGYLAPEQILGRALDRRVDVFAAGATLYHLAALEKPFDTPTGPTLDPARLPTVPLRVLRPDLPREFADAIERALAVEPDARFQTARELRNALPVPSPDAAEALGRLVRRVCAAAIVRLEEKTDRATGAFHNTGVTEKPSAKRQTEQLAAATAPTPPELLPTRRRTPLLILGALGLVLVGAVGAWFMTSAFPPEVANVAPDAGASTVPENPTPVVVATVVDAGPAVPEPHVVVPASSPGLLTVEATPWANLTLDGANFGETPRADIPVPPGVHMLVATCPDTGKTVRKKVTVVSGRPLQVRLDLR